MKRIALLLSLSSLFSSCFERGDCTGVSYNLVNIGFYNFSDKKEKTVALDYIEVDGFPDHYFEGKSVSNVLLPLHPESDTVTYNIHFGGSFVPLTVYYKIRTFALAPDCDAIDIYSLVDAKAESINEVIIKQYGIVKTDAKNIYLYF